MTWKGEKVDDLEIIHWWRSSGCDEWVVVVVRNQTLGKKEDRSASMAAFMCSCFKHQSSCSRKTEWFDILKNTVVRHLEKTEWFNGEIHHILCLWFPVRKSTSQTFLRDFLSENLLLKTLKVLHNWNLEYCTTELWHFFRLPKLWLLHCYFGIDTTMKPPVDVLSKCLTFNSLQFLQLNHSRNDF